MQACVLGILHRAPHRARTGPRGKTHDVFIARKRLLNYRKTDFLAGMKTMRFPSGPCAGPELANGSPKLKFPSPPMVSIIEIIEIIIIFVDI